MAENPVNHVVSVLKEALDHIQNVSRLSTATTTSPANTSTVIPPSVNPGAVPQSQRENFNLAVQRNFR